MNKNIYISWSYQFDTERNIIRKDKPKVATFLTKRSGDLNIPSMGFNCEEDAELAVAIAKALKVRNKNIDNMGNELKYVFRVLGFTDSGWCD